MVTQQELRQRQLRDISKQRRRLTQQIEQARPTKPSNQEIQAQLDFQERLKSFNKQLRDFKLAEKLIFSGREFAAAGDPGVQRKIKQLREAGFTSAFEKKARRKFIAQLETQRPTQGPVPTGITPGIVAEGLPKEVRGPTIRERLEIKRQISRQFPEPTPRELALLVESSRPKPILDVQPVERPRGFISRLEETQAIEEQRVLTGRATPIERAKAGIAAAALPIISFPRDIFTLGKSLITEPITTVKRIPGGVSGAVTRFGRKLETAPEQAFGQVIGEVVLLKGISKGAKVTGEIVSVGRTRISPKFKLFSETGLEEAGSVKSISIPLKKQVKLAGMEIDAVSAARDFFKPFEKEKVIGKPKPTPTAPELERALFADPFGRVRISRLGLEPTKEAGILDILGGDITFRRTRPQILSFERTKVEAFPEALKDIEKSLKAGKPLTVSQRVRLEKFQLEPTGKFKPIGFVSKEPEVVLAPGEIVLIEEKLPTIIKGKRVELFKVKIETATGKTKELLKEFSEGKLSKAEIKELRKRLKKEGAFDITSDLAPSRPFVSPSGIFTDISRFISPKPPSKPISPTPSLSPTLKAILGVSQGISLGVSKPPIIKSVISIAPSKKPSAFPSVPPSLLPNKPSVVQISPPSPPSPIPKRPIVTIVPPPPSTPTGLAQAVKKIKEMPEFEVFVKKFGKDVSIGKEETKKEAVGLLKKRLQKTLRASGFIVRGGKKIDPFKRNVFDIGFTSNGFRRGKKDPFRVVEKKEKRIKRGTFEVPEIQLFRKAKKNIFGV